MQDDVKREIFKTLKKGVFTPFLGAGASSLRPTRFDFDRYPWLNVAQTLAAVRCDLHTERSWNYLRSFASQRLRMSERLLDRFLTRDEKPELVEELKGNQLVGVQVQIVRATVRLTNYIGMHLGHETPAIHSLEGCRIPFKASRWEGEEAVHALFRAADITLEARDRRTRGCESPFVLDQRRVFGVDRVYEKLLKVLKILTDHERDVFKEEIERHADLEDTNVEESGYLRLDLIQWLSDLLWYSVRYWVPCYPTTAELAFELSLHVINAPVRRAELAQAAQALETENLADLSFRIRLLMDYCEDWQDRHGAGDRSTAQFYDAIAAALQHQFDRYSKTAVLDPAVKWTMADSQLDPPPLPMAFTTNFDRALERAFERGGAAFHVLFPVIPSRARRSGSELAVSWKLRSWHSAEQAKATGTRFEDQYWKDICPEGGNPDIEWRGPLIVKLHGSPSEQPGKSDDHHWVVLSEVGYLQALNRSAMPIWVRRQLQDTVEAGEGGRRSLWFLGYSIADWNVRLRLYQDSQVGGPRQTFNRDADPYRMALLTILGITTFLGDLNEFPRYIEKALKDNEIETTKHIDELVVRLAGR